MVRFVGNKQSKYVNLALCEFSASKGEKLTYVLASIKLGKRPCLSTMWLKKAMRDYFVRYTRYACKISRRQALKYPNFIIFPRILILLVAQYSSTFLESNFHRTTWKYSRLNA